MGSSEVSGGNSALWSAPSCLPGCTFCHLSLLEGATLSSSAAAIQISANYRKVMTLSSDGESEQELGDIGTVFITFSLLQATKSLPEMCSIFCASSPNFKIK